MRGSNKKFGMGFVCPRCGSDATHVSDSRGNPESSRRRRRRFCERCEHRFSTVEITDAEYEALLGSTALAQVKRELIAVLDRRMAGRIVLRPETTEVEAQA